MIDENTGRVLVIGDLDYELGSRYTLTVTAKDQDPNSKSKEARAKLEIKVSCWIK